METIIELLTSFQLNMIEVGFLVTLVFVVGFWIGRKKVKNLNEKIYSLQKDVLDLNAELLYGKEDNATPVIGIKHEGLKGSKMAN